MSLPPPVARASLSSVLARLLASNLRSERNGCSVTFGEERVAPAHCCILLLLSSVGEGREYKSITTRAEMFFEGEKDSRPRC